MKRTQTFWLVILLTAVLRTVVQAESPPLANSQAVEFFEKEVRPILVEKCQSCHDDKKQHGSLRLNSRDAVLKGGETGPAIVPGKPAVSLLIEVLSYQGELKMPPTGKLTDSEIGKFKRWIAGGAVWPVAQSLKHDAKPGVFEVKPAQRNWWAFQAIRDTTPPAGKATNTEIDRFIQSELAGHGLQAARPADRYTWLRRATFDLTGLPPTSEEINAFQSDQTPQAFEKVIDRLLASPSYGQRWARHWLDVVRYADYYDANPKTRTPRCELTEAWRYRDWVVDSLNRDLPFDQFIVHQIAGDLLPNPTGEEIYPAGLIATTFLSNGAWDRGDADKEKMVSDMVDDNIDTIGKAFLGLTLGCARCHDHKYDPISHDDYYGLAGIFYSTHILESLGAKGDEYTLNRVPLVPRAQALHRDSQVQRLESLKSKLVALDKVSPPLAPEHPSRLLLSKERDALQAALPPPYPLAMAVQEWGVPGGLFPNIQDVPIHIRGSYTRLGPVVPRHFPRFLAGESQPKISSGSGRRELASWIASPRNPLTARVIANRVWQWHFGEGLVRTSSNFGLLSEPPSHPLLLDWLASRFVAEGWSLKKMHRRIMLSAAYRQSSVVPREQVDRDPENRWLGRFSARRLESEAIRDAMLFISGKLDASAGGPAGDDLNILRRSLYVQTARWDRGSFAILFDAANPDASTEKRVISTVAPQSLFLMNHSFVLSQANELAKRLIREAPTNEDDRIQRAYQLLFARRPRPGELAIARQMVEQNRQNEPEATWTELAHLLLCSNEFVYLD